MSYLLDTEILVSYLRNRHGVAQKLLSIPATDLYTSTICIGELYYGAAKSQKPDERKSEVDKLRNLLNTIAPTSVEMETFGVLKAKLEAKGQRLADADLIIAATALEHNLTLVTGNLNHFRRINNLKLESWVKR